MIGTRKRPFIAGNWKMHMILPEAEELVRGIVQSAPEFSEADLVVIPPFTALGKVEGLVRKTPIGMGGQNLFWEEKGAYTGEISGPLLKDAGCSFVLIGHSERRQYFVETDETVNKKIRAALSSGLKPIVCVGETLEDREDGKTIAKVDVQLETGLGGLAVEDMAKIILAYEPVWAIGTGLTATPAQAEEVQRHIRGWIEERYGNEQASCAIILYGGSVKAANAYSLFKEKDIDGFLVGGASLGAGSFLDIAREALRAYREEK